MEKQITVGHIYVFTITWLALFLFVFGREIHSILTLILLFMGSFGVAFLAHLIFWNRQPGSTLATPQANEAVEAANEATLSEDSDVSDMIRNGTTLLQDLNMTCKKIQNQALVQKVQVVIEISFDIIEKLRRKPEQLPSVRRFLNYYLPTTKKLLENYSYMERQSVKGENIISAMAQIEHSLDILVAAYKKQLDKLFSHTAMDIATDISVLESVLKSEGLSGERFPWEDA